MKSDTQKQRHYHDLAKDATLEGKKATEAGERKLAVAWLVRAERWFRMYRKYGGKESMGGP